MEHHREGLLLLCALVGWPVRTCLPMRLNFLLLTTEAAYRCGLVHDHLPSVLSQYQLIQSHLILLLVHDLILHLSGLLLLSGQIL